MPSDQTVTSKVVLACVLEIQRLGTGPALEHLEQVEPDLANYLMETLGTIHQRLTTLNGPTRSTQRVYRQVEVLIVVCITALRRSHYELWCQNHTPDETTPSPPRES